MPYARGFKGAKNLKKRFFAIFGEKLAKKESGIIQKNIRAKY